MSLRPTDAYSWVNWPNSQIPECTCSISHNAPFRTEMWTFLFWMEHCGIWNRCILGFVKLVYWVIIGSSNSLSPIYLQTAHYLKQGQFIVYLNLWNKLQCNLNQNMIIFITETAFENAVCWVSAILFKPLCGNSHGLRDGRGNYPRTQRLNQIS